MQIKILYFGRPSENLKLSDETVDVPDSFATLGELLAWLQSRGENWKYELSQAKIRCAINQEFAAWETPIQDQDEIAIFSPISGG